jgi:ornithine lipid hydroxylase
MMAKKTDTLIVWLTYPAIVAAAFTLHYVLKNAGADLFVATYVPAFTAAGLVTLAEWLAPAQLAWRPDKADIANDLTFMVIVQLALPPALSLFAALALVDSVNELGIVPATWWPHHWPVAAQGLLILFSGDFVRYWLHRASHKNKWLWRLHAVHHSPTKLYWLNVGRFHPIEKALQFLGDTLPFLLLGVGKEAVAFYFLFYSVNGFLLHSNIRLRYGFLNYIFNTAELHRWHHSKLPKESDNNYGNHVMIWDLLFGTWFLPKDREVGPLGLRDKKYPMSFFGQMTAPFQSNTRAGA